MRRGSRVARSVVALAALLLGSPRRASAEGVTKDPVAPAATPAACYDAHEAGQLARKEKRLRKARQLFATCAQMTCPAVVQRDCAGWATELATEQPSIVVEVVRGDGSDVLGARLVVDDEAVPGDGRAVELDPGEHRIRVEATGLEPRELRLTVREGDRLRRMPVVLSAPKATAVAATSSGPPTLTYVLGGVAILSAASFGTFAVLGKSRERELDGAWGNRCSDAQVDEVRTRFIVADISLAAAVLSAGAALVVWGTGKRDVPATRRR